MKKVLIILGLLLTLTVNAQLEGIISQTDGADPYGPELITNGAIGDGTSWSWDASWSIVDGVAIYSRATNNHYIRQVDGDMQGSTKANTNYRLVFDITISSGNASILITVGDGNYDYVIKSNYPGGTNEVFFTSPANIGVKGISFYGSTDSSNPFGLDNISLKEVL